MLPLTLIACAVVGFGVMWAAREQERIAKEQQKEAEREAKQREKLIQDTVGTFAKSAARSLGGSTGQKIVRGLLGSLFGRK